MAGKLQTLGSRPTGRPGRYPDGDGLYLIVAGPTSRNWSYRYWIKGRERWHGLGSLLDLSLKDARIKRDAARQEVRAGVDIVQGKRSAREGARAEAAVVAASTSA
jgi:Arm DNA-binding domain